MEQARLDLIIRAVNRTDTAMRALNTHLNTIKRVVRDVNRDAAQGARQAGQALRGVGQMAATGAGAVQRLGQNFGGLRNLLNGLGNPLRLISGLFSGLGSIFNVLGGIASRVFGVLSGLLSRVVQGAMSVVGVIGGALTSTLQRLTALLAGAAKTAALGFGAALAAIGTRGVMVNESMMRLESSFALMMKSQRGAKDAMAELRKEARTSMGSMLELGSAWKSAMAFGFSLKEAKDMTRVLGDAASSMAPAGESPTSFRDRLVAVFGKIRATGKMQGDEANQLQEAGINVRDVLGMPQGADFGEIAVPAQVAIPKLLAGLQSKFGGQQEGNIKTLGGAFEALGDTIDQVTARVTTGLHQRLITALQNVEKTLGSLLETAAGQTILQTLSNGFDALGNMVVKLSDAMPGAVNWLGQFIQSGQAADTLARVVGWVQAIIQEAGVLANFLTGGQGIAGAWDTFKNAAVNSIDFVLKVLSGLGAVVLHFGKQWPMIWAAIQDAIARVGAVLEVVVGAIQTMMQIGLVSWAVQTGMAILTFGSRIMDAAAAFNALRSAGAGAMSAVGAALRALTGTGATGTAAAGAGRVVNAVLPGAGAGAAFNPYGAAALVGGAAAYGLAAWDDKRHGRQDVGIGGTLYGLGLNPFWEGAQDNSAGAAEGFRQQRAMGLSPRQQMQAQQRAAQASSSGIAPPALSPYGGAPNFSPRAGGGYNLSGGPIPGVDAYRYLQGQGRDRLKWLGDMGHWALNGLLNQPIVQDTTKVFQEGFNKGGIDPVLRSQFLGGLKGRADQNAANVRGTIQGWLTGGGAPGALPGGDLPPGILMPGDGPRPQPTITVLPRGMNAGTGYTYTPGQGQPGGLPRTPTLDVKALDAKVSALQAQLALLESNPKAADAFKKGTLLPAMRELLGAYGQAQPYETEEKRFDRLRKSAELTKEMRELLTPKPNDAVSQAVQAGQAGAAQQGGFVRTVDGGIMALGPTTPGAAGLVPTATGKKKGQSTVAAPAAQGGPLQVNVSINVNGLADIGQAVQREVDKMARGAGLKR